MCGPAPTLIVGMRSSSVTRRAASAGTISSTTANAPASSTACASASSCSTPLAAALDDVAAEPVLALRGEADVGHDRDARDTIRRICSALRTPPSSFTAWAPVSFMKRKAVCSASSGPVS